MITSKDGFIAKNRREGVKFEMAASVVATYAEKIQQLSGKAQAWADLPNKDKAAMLRQAAATVSQDSVSTARVAANITKTQKLAGTESGDFESLLQALILFMVFPQRCVR